MLLLLLLLLLLLGERGRGGGVGWTRRGAKALSLVLFSPAPLVSVSIVFVASQLPFVVFNDPAAEEVVRKWAVPGYLEALTKSERFKTEVPVVRLLIWDLQPVALLVKLWLFSLSNPHARSTLPLVYSIHSHARARRCRTTTTSCTSAAASLLAAAKKRGCRPRGARSLRLKTSNTRFLRIRNPGHFTPRLVSLFAWAALHAIAAFPPQNKYTRGAFNLSKRFNGLLVK